MLQDLPQHWQLWPLVPIVIFKVKLDFAVIESFSDRQVTPSLHSNPCMCSCGCTFHHLKWGWSCSALYFKFGGQKGYVNPVAPSLNAHILSQKYNEILNLPLYFGHEPGKYYKMIGQ